MTVAHHIVILSREYPPTTVGGTSTVARNVGVGLAELGWEVTVITTNPGQVAVSRESVDGVTVYRTPTEVVYHPGTELADQSLRVHRRLFAMADQVAVEKRIDLIVLPDLFCYPEAAMLARKHNAPVINILLQDFRAIVPYDRDKHRVTNGVAADRKHLLEIEHKAVHDSDHTVFISNALATAINGYYPGREAASSVVHLGVEADEVDAVRRDPQWAAKRSHLPDRPLMVACGRLVPVKGYTQLLQAMAQLDMGDPARLPQLVLVGVGPEEPTLRLQAEQLGLSSRVTFLGAVPRAEALGWMSVADVCVVPSLWESFCYVCAEMMAMGVPVVATAVDSLRELMPSEEFGYPVPMHGPSGGRVLDPGALAAALHAALDDPAEARRRGRAARDRILGTFTNKRFAKGISTLAGSLLADADAVGSPR